MKFSTIAITLSVLFVNNVAAQAQFEGAPGGAPIELPDNAATLGGPENFPSQPTEFVPAGNTVPGPTAVNGFPAQAAPPTVQTPAAFPGQVGSAPGPAAGFQTFAVSAPSSTSTTRALSAAFSASATTPHVGNAVPSATQHSGAQSGVSWHHGLMLGAIGAVALML
ncbi:hypothetical protein AB1N83_003830 [Pleurotus pulmonarius]|nr:hypothetical protein EYR36_007877 [Pleurotus pulmonarius]